MKNNFMNRKLLLSGDINYTTIFPIMQSIIDINSEDEMIEKINKQYKRVPIQLFINSPGGNVYDGFALIDVIRASKTPVHTIALGSAMSMGMLIYKRFVGEYSTLMFHDVSSAIADKLEGIQDRIKELKRIQAMICTIVTNHSEVPLEQLAIKLNQRDDWYISAEEALQYKLAEDYFKNF